MSFPGYALLDAASLALTARGASVGTAKQFLTNWNPDLFEDGLDVFTMVIGPEDGGDSSVKKWWRGLVMEGTGRATVMAFNFPSLNAPGFLLEASSTDLLLADDGSQCNIISFPRGTKGYYITVIIAVQGRMDWAELLFDPIGTAMGDQ